MEKLKEHRHNQETSMLISFLSFPTTSVTTDCSEAERLFKTTGGTDEAQLLSKTQKRSQIALGTWRERQGTGEKSIWRGETRVREKA